MLCRDEDLAEALDSVGGDQDADKDGIIQVQNLPPPQRAKLWMVSVCVLYYAILKLMSLTSPSIARYYGQLV